MMDPINYLTFDGVPSTTFKCYTNGNQTFLSSDADIESKQIPGKSGDLLRFNKRFNNVDVAYDCWIAEHMRENLRALRSFLLSRYSYVRLEDTYHPDEYRMAVYSGSVDPTVSFENTVAAFTLTFNCKPQRFLKSGEITSTSSNGRIDLFNPSYIESKPLIRIYGNGTLTVGNKEIVVSNNEGQYLDFDCELMDAYTGEVNRNSDIVTSDNDFVTLHSGSVSITSEGDITSFEVTPRWFYL